MPGHNARNTSDTTKYSVFNTPYSMREAEYVEFEEKKKMPWPIKNYGQKALRLGLIYETAFTAISSIHTTHNLGEVALICAPPAIICAMTIPLMSQYVSKIISLQSHFSKRWVYTVFQWHVYQHHCRS